MPQVLEGIRVVDATTGPAAGMATMVLADFGADVVKVEAPGGDRFRALAASPLWLRGKRSVTADLATPAGLAVLHGLVAAADVLVVSGPPSRARRWGVDADAASALRPDLVHCSITGWGPTGPLAEVPGYEAAVAARAGRMVAFERQLRRGGPVFAAVPIAGHVAAHAAVLGVSAALLARARGGGAQRVETSLLQGLLPFDLVELLLVEMAERSGLEAPNILATGGDMPTLNYHPVRTADGRWIQCGNLLEHLLMAFLDATDLLGELFADERFLAPMGTWDEATVDVARDHILLRLQEKTADEWMAIFRADGNVAAEVYLTTTEALHHPDLVAGGDVVTIADPMRGPVRTLGPAAELTATPAVIGRPAPRPGEHTTEVTAEWGRTPQHSGGTATGSPSVPDVGELGHGRPLDGVRIVEFSTIIAAPIATTFLADLGASVIKAEVLDGDPYRHLIPGGTPVAKTSAGKTSIAVDLKTAEGRAIAARLCADADVVVHNARPGVPERLGLGPEQLRADHPDLIWVSLTGYNRHSPAANRPATHPVAGAAAGGAGYQGGAATTTPCETLADVREISRQLIRANEANPDPNSGAVLGGAIALALLARERFGIAQDVYVNMFAANMYANADDAVEYAGRPPRPAADDELHGTAAGYRLYRAADGWVFLAAWRDDEWRRVGEVVGIDIVGDARFATAADRTANDTELVTALAAALGARPADEWEAGFVAAGVAGVRADGPSPGVFWAHDEHVLANGFTPVASHTRFGPHRRWGPIVTLNDGPGDLASGVLSGEQTDAILDDLGFDGAAIEDLRARRIVASEPVAWA